MCPNIQKATIYLHLHIHIIYKTAHTYNNILQLLIQTTLYAYAHSSNNIYATIHKGNNICAIHVHAIIYMQAPRLL